MKLRLLSTEKLKELYLTTNNEMIIKQIVRLNKKNIKPVVKTVLRKNQLAK